MATCLTVTGRTVAENLKNVGSYPANQDVVYPLSNPIRPRQPPAHPLWQSCAPGGSVAKISGKEGLTFSGKAIVFESGKPPFTPSSTAV